ncbi:MAG TPA: hypothetical protein PL133_04685 [Methylophilaceae bacterium]|nr:hypothetical protein [Methylophilaceae bacterium]HPX88544.1 hypothetical protein [Methylophilaceae bacterium]HQC28195.1 hypothetical protein [Methylotenera sp.]
MCLANLIWNIRCHPKYDDQRYDGCDDIHIILIDDFNFHETQ